MQKLTENRSIVVPGEPLYEGEDLQAGTGTYAEDGQILSRFHGTVEYRDGGEVRVKPMRGRYIPQEGDSIIGKIEKVSYSNWIVDLNSPYDAVLPIGEAVEEYVDLSEDDIADWFDVNEMIVAKIQKVTKGKDVQLTMKDRRAKKIEGGMILRISPTKVPRVIGRKGTMVNMIKNKTDCTIVVGQNGRVWIKGEDEGLAAKAVRKVEREAREQGLTDKVEEWLDERANGGER